LTTGVYCRPSCASRIANPKNVLLHDTFEEAKATGFRPCKRCNPDGLSVEAENVAIVARACRLIEESEEEPSLADLAAAAGRSPSYFHRRFKAATGLTPKDYAVATRASKVRERLASGTSVTEAIYDAGFNSSGRFYEKSTGMLRAGGANEEIRFAVGETSLGTILVASSKKGVASILLGGRPEWTGARTPGSLSPSPPDRRRQELRSSVAHVIGFIEAPRIGLDLPLDVRGTAFQRRVWQALQGVPIGQTVFYTEIARRSALPTQCARSPAPAPRTTSPSPSRVTGWCGTTDRSQATRGVSSASRPCLRARRRAAFSAANTVWRVRNLPSAQRNRHLQYESENRSELTRSRS